MSTWSKCILMNSFPFKSSKKEPNLKMDFVLRKIPLTETHIDNKVFDFAYRLIAFDNEKSINTFINMDF